MLLSSCCLAGRSALPLEPGDGGHRGMPQGRQGQAMEPTKSAIHEVAGPGQLRSRVGWWSACGWGSGMPAPSGQIPPPWARWENEAPTTRAACCPSQATRLVGLGVSGPGWFGSFRRFLKAAFESVEAETSWSVAGRSPIPRCGWSRCCHATARAAAGLTLKRLHRAGGEPPREAPLHEGTDVLALPMVLDRATALRVGEPELAKQDDLGEQLPRVEHGHHLVEGPGILRPQDMANPATDV